MCRLSPPSFEAAARLEAERRVKVEDNESLDSEKSLVWPHAPGDKVDEVDQVEAEERSASIPTSDEPTQTELE